MLDGLPTGTTVSSFASLSVDPPMVFFALDNRGSMLSRVQRAGRVGINILAGDQADIAATFASPSPVDRFSTLAWHVDDALPRIEGVAAWLGCDELTFEPGGDHTIVLAKVSGAKTFGDSSLGYHLRRFRAVPAECAQPPAAIAG